MKLGLAMSGGGIKGAAHIGVIQALQEEGIKVDIVGGTSIGSIVAALYAMGYTPSEMVKLFNYFSKLIFKNSAMYTDPRGKKLLSIQAGGLYSGENIAFAIEEAGKYKNIKKLQDLKIPIVIPAVDLRDSEKYVFTNMEKLNDKYLNKADISIAVRASSSYPAIFAPCIYNKHKFVDGGILDNIPVEEVKNIGADKVIAIRFKLNKTSRTIGLRSTLNKSIDIMFSKIEGEAVKKADYVIEIDTQDVNPFDFKQTNKCYKYGYIQAKKDTINGSSYNSYLIEDEKIVLIYTAWKPFDEEFVENLKQEIDLNKIDYIIANHGEVDHSGSLPKLMKEIPNTPIYCTANGVKSIKGQYHEDWNFVTVKTGDTLNIGKHTLTFIEAPMLHWPDTMFTYMDKENILFSNDAFGQHIASEYLYADEINPCVLYNEAIKYYANIVAPFSMMVKNKINEILKMNIPINMICPSHGLIWRENPTDIIDRYYKWADNYSEEQITILYDTMWNDTRKMAEAIAKGIKEANKEIEVKIINTAKSDKTEIIAEVFKSKGIVIGSPTVNNGYLYSIAGIMEMIKGLKAKNKKAASFGSYGWSGEAVKLLNEELKKAGFILINEGLRCMWTPTEENIKECIEFGKELVKVCE